jgi:hypothetical protein
MSSRENFVITIGDFGSIVALHSGNSIKESLFLENLDDESKEKLKSLFAKNKSATISILLDNLDQTYKKKSYPLINLASLKSIAKREIESDGDRNSFKNYIPFIPKKSSRIKKTDCLFISISKSEIIDEWLNITLEFPNRLLGIYALPVESFTMFNLLKKKENKQTKMLRNSEYFNLSCLIIQTKVGGIRQIIFSGNGIIFTRILNYNLEEPDCLEKYERDIYSTFEYLKRSTPNINITELHITNILSEEFLEKIKKIENLELKISNYTPSEVSSILGYKDLFSQDERFVDLLISKSFSKEKKILKFTTSQIITLEKFFLVLLSSYVLSGIAIAAILFAIISITMFSIKTSSVVKSAKESKKVAEENLENTKALAVKENIEDESKVSADLVKIIDYGKIDETLGLAGTDHNKLYASLKFLKSYNTVLKEFTYSLNNFDQKNPTPSTQFIVSFKGDLNNKTGDIDDLFKNFDNLVNFTKNSFADYSVANNEIPRTIDFAKRYYTYPIELKLEKK